jgi:hypothetical protein
MHISNYPPPPPAAYRWGEIGWYKSPNGSRGIFTYSTDYPWVSEYPNFPISTGQLLHFQIYYQSCCGQFYVLYWFGGNWLILTSFSIGQDHANSTDLVNEAFNNDSTHLVLPNTQVDGTLLQTCTPVCSWVNWNTSIPTVELNNSPYEAHYQNKYYQWYGHSH